MTFDKLFDICVDILKYIASATGTTYKEANIWIFVIIHPLITLTLLILLILKIRAGKKGSKNKLPN